MAEKKMEKFSKQFEDYQTVCAISLYVCGEASPSYQNNPGNINWFSFGVPFNEVDRPRIAISKTGTKEFDKKKEVLREKLNNERSK